MWKDIYMKSEFQFSNPSLLKLSFGLNEGFGDNEKVKIAVKPEVEIGSGPEKDSSVVILKLAIGNEDASAPFYIYAEEGAVFKWNAEKIDEQHKEKLLKQNAPALLLSYLRPTISVITAASPFNAYDIPFMNFTKE